MEQLPELSRALAHGGLRDAIGASHGGHSYALELGVSEGKKQAVGGQPGPWTGPDQTHDSSAKL